MLRSYELTLIEPSGARRFQPLLSESELDACMQARKVLEQDHLAEVEVSRGGEHLITFYPARQS